ncbi:MAG: hypothetical protein JXA09_05610 [Anaerolineae bacterium]|nr:hypothetical protein [Anaerolineae bacterium]
MTRYQRWLACAAFALLALPAVLGACGPAMAPPIVETAIPATAAESTPTHGTSVTSTPAEPPTVAETQTPESRSTDGLPLPAVLSEHFAGSGTCAVCHSRLVDRSGADVSLDTHWRSTMMANGARDPLWQAKVSSEVARNPGLRETIEAKCATCHTPMAWTEVDALGGAGALLQDGFLDPANELHEIAMDGISCTLCHQIEDQGLGDESSYSGGYAIDTVTEPPDRLIYGPFPDPIQRQMQMHTGFIPVEGPHVREASLCATCHTLYTPYVDAAGNVAGTFPEQVVYLEWAHSAYAESVPCQGCHMPAASGRVAISNMPRMVQPREPFSQHHFVGGNAFMAQVLSDHVAELGLTASSSQLDATHARTVAQLESKAARIEVVGATAADGQLEVVLAVTNETGHKFPSGFPSRRAWIHLVVTDADAEIAFESGRPGGDGSIAGGDADGDIALYEPHYDLIVDQGQVQIYESVMQDTDGAVTYTLLRGAAYVKDNRLLPKGFEPSTAQADVAPRGAAAQDASFRGGEDRLTYQIDVSRHVGPYVVSVELLYQAVSFPFALDLWMDEGASVERMKGYYGGADHTPVVVWRAGQRVP